MFKLRVFGYENGQLFPLKIFSYESEFLMDLLLLYDDDHHPYVLINHLVKVVCYVRRIDFCFWFRICRNWFWICRDGLESYSVYMTNCGNNAPAVIQMPSSDQISYKFTNLSATWFVLLVIYFDFESFLRPVSGCRRPSSRALTQVKELHKQCGCALTVIDHHCSKPIFYQVDSFQDWMAKFVKSLQKLARNIHKQMRKYPFFKSDRRSLDKSQAKQCWICEKPFSEVEDPENLIDLYHCHHSGNIIGWAHEKCNRAKRNVSFIPIVGHTIQAYDLHHIFLYLNNCESTTTISVIPATDKKYISTTFVELIDTFVNKNGTTVKAWFSTVRQLLQNYE